MQEEVTQKTVTFCIRATKIIRTGLTVLYAYLCLYCNYFIFIFQIMPFVFLQKLV